VLERTSKTNHTLIPCHGQLAGMQSSPPRGPSLPSWTATRGRGAKRSATQQILGSNHGRAPAMNTTQGNSASTSPTAAFAFPTASQGSPTANERGLDVEGTCMGEPNNAATTHEESQQEEHLEGEGEDLPAAPTGGNQQGDRGTSFAARVMEHVEGGNYDAEADEFAEGWTAKSLNDDVRLQMEQERENAKTAREACASKEADLKEALAMAMTLTVHVVDEQVRHVNVERLVKDSVLISLSLLCIPCSLISPSPCLEWLAGSDFTLPALHSLQPHLSLSFLEWLAGSGFTLPALHSLQPHLSLSFLEWLAGSDFTLPALHSLQPHLSLSFLEWLAGSGFTLPALHSLQPHLSLSFLEWLAGSDFTLPALHSLQPHLSLSFLEWLAGSDFTLPALHSLQPHLSLSMP
ncbi:unnamed protein product, partial [Closterium sp. Naga37s-1]